MSRAMCDVSEHLAILSMVEATVFILSRALISTDKQPPSMAILAREQFLGLLARAAGRRPSAPVECAIVFSVDHHRTTESCQQLRLLVSRFGDEIAGGFVVSDVTSHT